MTELEELSSLVRTAIHEFSNDIPISPEVVSGIVIDQIDPDSEAPTLVRFGCVLELRQLSRAELRKTFEEEDPHDDLFGDDLPPRMPGFGENKGKYMPRDLMTEQDYEGNIARYRKELSAKQRRLDKLIAEFEEKKARGLFSDAA